MDIFWIYLNSLKKDDFIEEILSFDKRNIVFTPNPEILLKAKKDKEFFRILRKADYLLPDGIGLYLAYQILDNNFSRFLNSILLPFYIFHLLFKKKYLYEKYGERICGSDLTKELLEKSSQKGIKIAILDLYNPHDEKKVASQKIFEEKLKQSYPSLQFSYFIFDSSKKDFIFKEIDTSWAKIIFSTLGMKTQEESIVECMEKCESLMLWIWVGSSFDYIVGMQKRAPFLFQKTGFEWLYRIFFWPQKLKRLKRIYNALIVFPFEVLISKK